jgi:hypothetical protein
MYRTLDWKGKKVTVGRYGQLQFFGRPDYWYIDKVVDTGDLPAHPGSFQPPRHYFHAAELMEVLQKAGLRRISACKRDKSIIFKGDEYEPGKYPESKKTDYHDIYFLNQELGYLYPEEEVKERIAYITENTKDIVFVAELDNEVIGYIHGRPYHLLYFDSLVDIMGIVVKGNFRNTGVGSALLNSLECREKENGYSGLR